MNIVDSSLLYHEDIWSIQDIPYGKFSLIYFDQTYLVSSLDLTRKKVIQLLPVTCIYLLFIQNVKILPKGVDVSMQVSMNNY